MRRIALVFILGLQALIFTNCALFGGGDSETLTRAEGYAVKAPAEWTPEKKNESDRAYRLSSGNMVTLTSSCSRYAKAPLEVLTRQLLIGARNINYKKRTRLLVNGAEGLHSSVQVTYEGIPFHMELFVLPKSSCVFDFSMLSRSPLPQKEVDEFLAFVQSFNYGT